MNGEPATKQDLLDLESRLTGNLESRLTETTRNLESRLTGNLESRLTETTRDLESRLTETTRSLEARLTETFVTALRETETKLLKAFFSYEERAELRLRKITTDLKALDATTEGRLDNLEQRVTEIEKRLFLGEQ